MFAITTKKLGKRYRLYRKPKDRLIEWLLLNKKKLHKDFWALQNISFDLVSRVNSKEATAGIQLLCFCPF